MTELLVLPNGEATTNAKHAEETWKAFLTPFLLATGCNCNGASGFISNGQLHFLTWDGDRFLMPMEALVSINHHIELMSK